MNKDVSHSWNEKKKVIEFKALQEFTPDQFKTIKEGLENQLKQMEDQFVHMRDKELPAWEKDILELKSMLAQIKKVWELAEPFCEKEEPRKESA